MKQSSVLIYGAGSIGAHLANACQMLGSRVVVYDVCEVALVRFRSELYPSRYGSVPKDVSLINSVPHAEKFDAVLIGTPPDTHLTILHNELELDRTKQILVEKPLCPTADLSDMIDTLDALEERGVAVTVGYNHSLGIAYEIFKFNLGKLNGITEVNVSWLESCEGILAAHPWLSSIKESYLGNIARGGGALLEHSHGIHLGLSTISHLLNGNMQIEIDEAQIEFSECGQYDLLSSVEGSATNGGKNLRFKFDTDFITKPTTKSIRVVGENGTFVALHFEGACDTIMLDVGYRSQQITISKDRPSEFLMEMELFLGDREAIRSMANTSSATQVIHFIANSLQRVQSANVV